MTIGYAMYLAISSPLSDQKARNKHLRNNHVIVWVPAFLLAFFPILFNGYAPVNDKSICWFSPEYPLLVLITCIPLSCYIVLSVVLIVFSYHRLRAVYLEASRCVCICVWCVCLRVSLCRFACICAFCSCCRFRVVMGRMVRVCLLCA